MRKRWLGIGALLLILLAAPLAVLWKPALIVNPTSLRWAAAFLYQRGIELHWDTLATEFTSRSFLEKDVRILARNLCLKSATATGCIPKAQMALTFHWRHGLTAFGPAEILAKDWTITPQPSEGEKEPFSLREWVARLEKVDFAPSVARLEGFRVVTANKETFSAQGIDVRLSQSAPTEWSLRADVTNAKGTALQNARATVAIRLPNDPANAKTAWQDIRLVANASLQERRTIDINGQIAAEGVGKLRFNAKSSMEAPRGVGVRVNLAGTTNKGRFESVLSADATRAIPQIDTVQVSRCEITGVVPHANVYRLALETTCPITLKDFRLPQPLRGKRDIPRAITVETHASYQMADTRRERFQAQGAVRLLPLAGTLLTWDGSASGDVTGRTSNLQNLAGTVTFDLKLGIPRLQRLVTMLRGSSWSVPAPFHVLNGALSCEAKSKIAIGSERFKVPFDCATNLTSETQIVKLVADNEFGWDVEARKPLLRANVTLLRTRLQLPFLQIQSLPRLGPDKRIILPSAMTEAAPATAPLTYLVNVRTATPLEILTNLANDPVPVDIPGMTLASGQTPEGRVVVRDFDVKAFRRNALINHVAMTFPGGTRPIELDGLVTIRNVDYNIHVTLLGTVDKPRFILTSDPPRPESELISSAFFGGSLDEMDSDTARSVADTRAALADGAINLVSMYFLASTPVESVGYNPESGVFRAKVRLAEGTSLSVGSDLRGQQSMGVRRRLSRNWAVETTVQRDLETDEQSERAMIRWARRY